MLPFVYYIAICAAYTSYKLAFLDFHFYFPQAAGFSVVADKLNFMRYLSHFRCVHRGAFFSQMRTTSVRKLLPEAWGKFFYP